MDKFWNGTFKFIFAVIGVVFAFSMLQVVWHYYHTIILLGLIATAIVGGLVLSARAQRTSQQPGRPPERRRGRSQSLPLIVETSLGRGAIGKPDTTPRPPLPYLR